MRNVITIVLFLGALTLSSESSLSASARTCEEFLKQMTAALGSPLFSLDPPAKLETGFILNGSNRGSALSGLSASDFKKMLADPNLTTSFISGKLYNDALYSFSEHNMDQIRRDNDFVVNQKRLSHRELAAPLLAVVNKWLSGGLESSGDLREGQRLQFELSGITYSIHADGPPGLAFDDWGNAVQREYNILTIRNESNGETIHFASYFPIIILRFGFYGKESEAKRGYNDPRYRIEPDQILRVFTFLAG